MYIQVLRADDEEDRGHWIDRWRLGHREPFAHPTFVELFADADAGDRCVAIVADLSQSQVLMPLIVRPIPGSTDLVDLTSPYGYSGAYVHAGGATVAESEQFWAHFDEWAESIGAVSVFSRMHLFADEVIEPPAGTTVKRAINIVRSLELSDVDMAADFEHKVRKNVRRARREKVTIEFDECGGRYADFSRVYASTMDRRSAADTYRFDDGFFARLHADLRGSFVYAHALHDSVVVSSELVLLSQRHGYSFLGGTLASHFALRPNDLLKVEVMRWCRERGLADFVLGGGATPGDGIERYKRSFSPSGQRWFETMERVLDADRYEALSTGSSERYFPAYRAPARETTR